LKWIIGSGVVALAFAIGLSLNFDDSIAYFYVPSEVAAQAGKLQGRTIKVGAMVKKGSVVWEAKKLSLTFVITDYEGHEFKVSHTGVKPDLFREGQGVVVEGRLNGTSEILSRNLMVKHSEEYKKPDAKHSIEKRLLQESIFKD
jgi:cytochrome c-type biogenesis protein CcmE